MRIRMGFWLKQSRTVLLFALAAGPAMCLYMWLINSGTELKELLRSVPLMSAWFAGFLQMAMSLSVYRLYLPLAISFGSTRKEAHYYKLSLLHPRLRYRLYLKLRYSFFPQG